MRSFTGVLSDSSKSRIMGGMRMGMINIKPYILSLFKKVDAINNFKIYEFISSTTIYLWLISLTATNEGRW